MADARSIRAGAAYVELFVNDSKLVRGLQSANKKLKAFGDAISGWGKKLAAAGSAITAPLIAFAKASASGSKELLSMSQRTGISVEALSELGYAAQISGSDMETLELGIRKMQKTIAAAAMGSKAATDALAQLGLTVEDLRGLSPDQQFKLIADKLASIQSPAIRAAMALAIFGHNGTSLLPMLSQGAAGIEAMQEQARRLGLTASAAGVQIGAELEETLYTLWKVLKKVGSTLGSSIAPLLTQWANVLIDIVVKGTAWIKQNKDLVVSVFKVALVVSAAGTALMLLGKAIVFIGGVFGVLASIVTGVGTVLGAIGSAIAWLLTPIGLVTAAVVALGAYLVYASGLGGKALEWLGQRFGELSEFASQAFAGISDALAAGDIALAAQILWLSLKIAWIKGVQTLESVWLSFRNFFIKIAYDAFYGALAACEIVWHGFEVAWIETTAFLSKVWTDFTSGFQKAWNSAINWTAKRLLDLQGLFDSSLDVDAAKKMADDDLAATNADIDKQAQAALQAREQQRQQQRADETQTHEAALTQIGQESQDKEQELDDEYAKKMQESQDELNKTREEWQKAIEEAKKKRQLKDAQGPDRLQEPPSMPDYLEGLGPTIAQKTIGVSGTFNAMEARGLGAGNVADRIAKASEDTAKHTKKLVDMAEQDDDMEFD